MSDFGTTVDLAPEDYRGWQCKAYAQHKLGQGKASLVTLRVAYDLKPTNIAILQSMFWRLEHHVSFAAADAFYSEQMALHPQEIWIARDLGEMRLKYQAFPEAAQAFASALQIDTSDEFSRKKFFIACRSDPDACPPLTPQERQARVTGSCARAIAETAALLSGMEAALIERGRFASVEEMLTDPLAGGLVSVASFVGAALEFEATGSPESAQRIVVLDSYLRCVDAERALEHLVVEDAVNDYNTLFGGAVRANLVDLSLAVLG